MVLEHERVSGVGEQPQPGPGNTARDDARVARRLDHDLAAVGHQRGLPDPGKARIGPTAVAVPQPILRDQLGRARVPAADELELARAYGAPRPIGIALRACGRLAARAERLTHLTEAVDVLSGSGAELEYARALIELGKALRVSGRRVAAREQLGRGYELATRCTATRLAEHAWQELLAAGARPRRKELKGVASLTPSERRIVELAADGRTNREIAQALFVTTKTVETHLGHAYTKLGVGSRTDLADALAAAGPAR